MMNRKRLRLHVAASAMMIAGAIALSGCGGGTMESGDQVYDRGREVNTTFKSAVASVQAQLSEDPWEVSGYGGGPESCDGGYAFDLGRTSPVGWGFGGDQRAAAEQLGEWLGTNGWSDVQVRTYEGGVTNVVLQARKEDAYVDRLDVDFNLGPAADVVIVRATSSCEPGDPNELMAELYPGWPTDTVEHEPLPSLEAPGDQPVFGFNEDGTPRR